MGNVHTLPGAVRLNETDVVILLRKQLQLTKREVNVLNEELEHKYIQGYRDGIRDASDKIEVLADRLASDFKTQALFALTDLLDKTEGPISQQDAGPVNAKGDPF